MALHLKADFAKMCGLTTGNLTNYIKRGKVILSGDYVDDTIPVNKDFLGKRIDKAEPAPPKLHMLRPDPGEPEIPDTGEDDEGGEAPGMENFFLLDKKYKAAQLKKVKVDTRLQELKEEKLRGELVPVELIKNLFRAYTQSIITANKDGIEELLINFSAEHRLRGDQLAALRGKVVGILNNSIDKSVAVAQKNLQAVINQVKVKRDVGERG